MTLLRGTTIILVLLVLQCCSYPEVRELKVSNSEYQMNITLEKNCNNSSTMISFPEISGKCVSLHQILSTLLKYEFRLRFLNNTGTYNLSSDGCITSYFESSGKPSPYNYNVELKFKSRETAIEPLRSVIDKLEDAYYLKVIYTMKSYTVYELKIVDQILYNLAVAEVRRTKKQPVSMNTLEYEIENRYNLMTVRNSANLPSGEISFEFPGDKRELSEALAKAGLQLTGRTVNIPYPSIEYL
ncbi:MAG: hypothetical protein WBA74_26505 [Cyclobacteriaceae bacterium]